MVVLSFFNLLACQFVCINDFLLALSKLLELTRWYLILIFIGLALLFLSIVLNHFKDLFAFLIVHGFGYWLMLIVCISLQEKLLPMVLLCKLWIDLTKFILVRLKLLKLKLLLMTLLLLIKLNDRPFFLVNGGSHLLVDRRIYNKFLLGIFFLGFSESIIEFLWNLHFFIFRGYGLDTCLMNSFFLQLKAIIFLLFVLLKLNIIRLFEPLWLRIF